MIANTPTEKRVVKITCSSKEEEREILEKIHAQLKGNLDYVDNKIILNDHDTRALVTSEEDNPLNEVHVYFFDDCSQI